MPKRKFRKIIIFIALLMMFVAWSMFNSSEYKDNYDVLVGRATCSDVGDGSTGCPYVLTPGTYVKFEQNKFYSTGSKLVRITQSGIKGYVVKATDAELHLAAHPSIIHPLMTGYENPSAVIAVFDIPSYGSGISFNSERTVAVNKEFKKDSPDKFKSLVNSDLNTFEDQNTYDDEIQPVYTSHDYSNLGVASPSSLPDSATQPLLTQPEANEGYATFYGKMVTTEPTSKVEKVELADKVPTLIGTTGSGKEVYDCGNFNCMKIGSDYVRLPTNTNVPVKQTTKDDKNQDVVKYLLVSLTESNSDANLGAKTKYQVALGRSVDIPTSGGGTVLVKMGEQFVEVTSTQFEFEQNGNKLPVYGHGDNLFIVENGKARQLSGGALQKGNTLAVINKEGNTLYYTPKGFGSNNEYLVTDEDGNLKVLTSSGATYSYTGNLQYDDGTIETYANGMATSKLTPTKTSGGQTVYSKSVPSSTSGYDTQEDRFYDSGGQLVKNRVLSFNNQPWLFDSDGVPHSVEDVTPDGSATKVYASYDYSEGKAVVYGENGQPIKGIQVKVKLLDGTVLTTTPTSDGVLVSDAAQKLMGTGPKPLAELPTAEPVKAAAKPSIDMSITSGFVTTDAEGNPVAPYQKVSFTDTQGKERQIATDVYNQQIVKLIDPKTTGETGGLGGKLSPSQAALLYEFMSKDHPNEMNANAVTCAGSVCHVGEDVYKVTTGINGRDIVDVYHGVGKVDVNGNFEVGDDVSFTSYSTAMGQLEFASVTTANGVALNYVPKTGEKTMSISVKGDLVALRYDKNTGNWIGIVEGKDVYVGSNGKVKSVGGKSCNIVDCKDIEDALEPMRDEIKSGSDKKLVERSKSVGSLDKTEERGFTQPEVTGKHIQKEIDDNGVYHYYMNMGGTDTKVEINPQVYDEQLSKLKNLDEKGKAMLYMQMYKDHKKDATDPRYIKCNDKYCYVDKDGSKEDAYYLDPKTNTLVVYKDGDGEGDNFDPNSFGEVVQYELDESGKPKKITSFEKVDGETVVTTYDASNPKLKKKVYSLGTGDKQVNFEQIGDTWSSNVPVANMLDDDEKAGLSTDLQGRDNLQIVLGADGKVVSVGGRLCSAGYQTDCDLFASKFAPLSTQIAANKMDKTVTLAGAQLMPGAFEPVKAVLVPGAKAAVAEGAVPKEVTPVLDASNIGPLTTEHGVYAGRAVSDEEKKKCSTCAVAYTKDGVTIYFDKDGMALGYQYEGEKFETYTSSVGPLGTALQKKIQDEVLKKKAGSEGGGVRPEPVELTLKVAELGDGGGTTTTTTTTVPKKGKVLSVSPSKDSVTVTAEAGDNSKKSISKLNIQDGDKTYSYDVYKMPNDNSGNVMLCYKDKYCYNKEGKRVDKTTGAEMQEKDDSTVIGKLVNLEVKEKTAEERKSEEQKAEAEDKKPEEEAKKKAEEDAKKKAEEEKKKKEAEQKKKAEEAKKQKKEYSYTPPKNVAGLDANGNLAACGKLEEGAKCDQSNANFMFKHDSLLKGTEGYVYVYDEEKTVYKDEATGKECTPGTPGAASPTCKAVKTKSCSAQEAANPESGCKAVNCDKVKGCKQTSDGDEYCTSFEGKTSCVNDPGEIIENSIEGCKDKFDKPECTGARKKMTDLYNNLDYEFRTRVETVFGSLFDDWTGNMFNKMELWMYSGICGMDYYDTGESEVDLILGQTITQENNYALNLDYLDEGEIIVTLAGEKQMVTPDIYRYSFSLQTIGAVHGVLYLYNTCTKEASFDQYGGWKDEFVVNKALGVHRMHYAGESTTFDCNATAQAKQECRFDHVCLKIMENEDYVKPICNKLGGESIILDTETGDEDCGALTYTGYET